MTHYLYWLVELGVGRVDGSWGLGWREGLRCSSKVATRLQLQSIDWSVRGIQTAA